MAVKKSNPWCVECRRPMWRVGYTDRGTRRWRCGGCGETVIASYRAEGVYKPNEYAAARELFLQGRSIREVAYLVGLSNDTSMKYRRLALKGVVVLCECGKQAEHRGWCTARLRSHPLRQAHNAIMASGGNKAFMFQRPVQVAVDRIVPKELPMEVRAEILQEVILMILSRKLSVQDAAQQMPSFIRAAWKDFGQSKYGELSLDAPIPHTEGMTWAEMISDNGEQAREIEDAA